MVNQNINNHARVHPPYHYVGLLLVLITFIGSIVHLISALRQGQDVFPAFLMVTGAVSLGLIFALFRLYSMKVQDRVIRVEEDFRYYRLTGNVLPTTVTMKQIVALRFASDEEFVALVERASKETMKPIDIKKSVKQWRGDDYRV